MTVQEKVAAVAKRFTEANYFFMNWTQLNVALDTQAIDKPTICYVLPASGTLTPMHSATHWKDAPDTQLLFLLPTDFDFDGAENDDKVELMKQFAIQFIRALNESGYFEMIDGEDLPYQVPYDVTDENVTGISLTVKLEEKELRKECEPISLFGYNVDA